MSLLLYVPKAMTFNEITNRPKNSEQEFFPDEIQFMEQFEKYLKVKMLVMFKEINEDIICIKNNK